MEESTELSALVAALQAGGEKHVPVETLPLHYQRAFCSESGRVVLADLVRNFPVIAARHLPGSPVEDAFQRDGAAQVVGHILTRMVSRPKARKTKKKAPRKGQPETQDDIN